MVTSFFVVLRRYLSFHGFSSLSRLGIAPKNWSNARCTKSSFQQVFICPKRIPIEGVMPLFPVTAICPVLISARASRCLRHTSSRGSSIVSIMDALNRGLDGDPEYSTLLHCKSLDLCTKLMRFSDVRS